MPNQLWMWILFNLFVLIMLAVDLGVFHRKSHEIKIKEALLWSLFWIGLSMLFNVGLYFWQGSEVALQFLTGYLIEKSLSVDNIFIFILLLNFFNIRPKYQHKILFWGIIGALIMRGTLIILGAALIQQFHWIIYLFGGFLVISGIKMVFHKDEEIHPEKNPVVKLFKRFMPVTTDDHGSRFFIKTQARWHATPFFIALLVIEITDLVFALDSIPAIFAITTNAFIVYTSNVFAILGLRALYFALAGIMNVFHYLKFGLSVVLVFIGLKMILADVYKLDVVIALIVVATILALSVMASLMWPLKSNVPISKNSELDDKK